MTARADAKVHPRRSPGPHHGGSLYLDCETNGLGVDAAITCIAVTNAVGETTTWHSGHAEKMTKEIASSVVDALLNAIGQGAQLYTFNGAAFDLKLLWSLSGRDEVRQMALDHCDLLVDFVCDLRYYASMDSFATATLRGDNTSKSNTGAWAATAWFCGEAERVLEYCANDTRVLKLLVEHVAKHGKLQRHTKAGKLATWVLPNLDGTIRPVAVAMKNASAVPAWLSEPPALPDISWTATDPFADQIYPH